MRKILVLFVFLFVILCLNAVDSIAGGGFGFYGLIGSGDGDGKVEVSGYPTENINFDTKYSGFGIVMDTAAGADKLFNYRFNLGYEKLTFKDDTGDLKLDSYVLDQDFGFGVLRSKITRLWLGPELRVSYTKGNDATYSDMEYKFWGFGIGPVAGIDFNLGDSVVLALKGGYLYTKYYGKMDSPGVSADYDLTETHAFGSVALIFKFGGPRDDVFDHDDDFFN